MRVFRTQIPHSAFIDLSNNFQFNQISLTDIEVSTYVCRNRHLPAFSHFHCNSHIIISYFIIYQSFVCYRQLHEFLLADVSICYEKALNTMKY